MNALDPDKNEMYKFLGCEQGDGIEVKCVMERVKAEVRKRLEQLIGKQLNDEKSNKSHKLPGNTSGRICNECVQIKQQLNIWLAVSFNQKMGKW